MIKRQSQQKVTELLSRYPAVGLLGPRQAGKTTLALEIAKNYPTIYLDLESPSDQAKLLDPEYYLSIHEDKLIILDEIQRAPNLFQILRGLIDKGRRQGHKSCRFLILASASLDLLQQSAETLAGRIIYTELTPLTIDEISQTQQAQDTLWLRGGFPDSYLAESDTISFEWRQAFIKTYLERDIPQLSRVPAETLRRFWTMLAHSQGGVINVARIAASLGLSGTTVARYCDLMVDLLLVRRLSPWVNSAGKRLVRSPKLYIRDSGLTHALLGLENIDALLSHPVAGTSWEGFVIENCLAKLPLATEAYFYRTSSGAEVDLIIKKSSGELWAIEIKRNLAPKPSKGFYLTCGELKPKKRFIVYPGEESFKLPNDITVISLFDLTAALQD